jgi:uncharacterized membrane protein YbhN (UPF0104 family)
MKYRRWLVSAVVVALLVLAGRRVDWRAAGAIARGAALAPLMAATLINLVSLMLAGVRWWIFLRRIGVNSLPLALRGVTIGAGLNNLLIANGGDAARVLLVARVSGVRRTSILASLALDRVFDPLCFGLLLFTATFVMPLPAAFVSARPIVGVALVVAAALLTWLVRTSGTGPEAVEPLKGFRAHGREFRDRVQGLATGRRFAMALLISLGVWILQMATFDLVARSVGVDLPLAGTLAALLLTNAGLLLRATPGNVGYFQFAYAVATASFGVHTDAAVAVGLLIQVVQIVPVMLLSLWLAPRMLAMSGDSQRLAR